MVLQFMTVHCFGHVSVIYKRILHEPFSIFEEVAAAPVQLLSHMTVFSNMQDAGHGMTKKNFSCLFSRAVRDQTDLQSGEIQAMSEYCFDRMVHHTKGKVCQDKVCAPSSLLTDTAYLNCAMLSARVTLPILMGLFNSNRHLNPLENFFMPQGLRCIKESMANRPKDREVLDLLRVDDADNGDGTASTSLVDGTKSTTSNASGLRRAPASTDSIKTATMAEDTLRKPDASGIPSVPLSRKAVYAPEMPSIALSGRSADASGMPSIALSGRSADASGMRSIALSRMLPCGSGTELDDAAATVVAVHHKVDAIDFDTDVPSQHERLVKLEACIAEFRNCFQELLPVILTVVSDITSVRQKIQEQEAARLWGERLARIAEDSEEGLAKLRVSKFGTVDTSDPSLRKDMVALRCEMVGSGAAGGVGAPSPDDHAGSPSGAAVPEWHALPVGPRMLAYSTGRGGTSGSTGSGAVVSNSGSAGGNATLAVPAQVAAQTPRSLASALEELLVLQAALKPDLNTSGAMADLAIASRQPDAALPVLPPAAGGSAAYMTPKGCGEAAKAGDGHVAAKSDAWSEYYSRC
eukprot:NODE_4093_length_1938_cov_4.633352.p1 GENE.NODE_4093_length_1938_cov_4.633352~~NODE_4093_length_1938_cov_4.633352.p1  ORF type:complete len:606 (+),score=103.09 NODE_4093_length_1938_cov_4.633352:87-1820(+)